ncbi:uncharacterized protein LOC102713233 [Oryza brachyantha]|uniref:uncharacterized protein LOC102713233 n=1 Tax=Oryza brachyantha TaxID=4533 RepID=UPI001ADC40D6|nr:uncharacterized protein LOC102713233 [Oryza brachyantha]
MAVEADIAPAAESGGKAATEGVKRRGGWVKRMTAPVTRRRGHYSPVGGELHAAAGEDEGPERRGGWLRRMMLPRDQCVHVQHRQRWWKLQGGGGSGSSSRLVAGLSRSLRWKATAGSLSGGWAAAAADAVSFRVMYVVEAVVLGLALSCFFCCCGCQI